MPLIGTRTFGGMVPRMDPELLADSSAVSAVNARLVSGKLEPWHLPTNVLTLSSLATVETIYRFGQNIDSDTQFWFEFTGDVNVVKGPVANDTQERTYWTDGDYPKKTDSTMATGSPPFPAASYKLAVPPPVSPVTPTVNGVADDPNNTVPLLTSTYFATYVTSWGEESAPSAASALVTWKQGSSPAQQTVTLTNLPPAVAGPYNIPKFRIYRSNTGSTSTDAQFLVELPVGTASYTDNTPGSALGETLETWDWDAPPDNLVGLTSMGNGILAGFFGNTLAFCEPNVPYAWPIKYQQEMNEPIVGLGAFGQSLFVGTTRGSYLFTGVDPASMTQETLSESQSCVSKRSIVQMLGGIVWASPDGLWLVNALGVNNLTNELFSRDEWQAYKPESVKGYTLNGRYYASYDTGSVQGTLIFTFGAEASFVKCDQVFSAAFVDRLRDQMYVVQAGNALNKWDAGASMTVTWRSKTYQFTGLAAMSVARVEAGSYPVTFRVFADGVQLGGDMTVPSVDPFRLPAALARTWAYEVQGTPRFSSVYLATSSDELEPT